MPEDDPHPRERHVALDGAVNFRDLGGYPAAGGRHVRWRCLYRADGLSSLSPADRALVRDLGVATVIDLRSTYEVDRGRFPVEDVPVTFHHLPLIDRLPDPQRFQATPGFMADHYEEIAHDGAAQIAKALAVIADPSSHPVIVHCTAGKDRTGVLVAVLLSLLGVPDEVVAEDYALSGRAMAALRRRLAERQPEFRTIIEAADELFSAQPAHIAHLLGALRTEHGSVAGYAAAAGAGPEVVAGLRAALLE